MMPRTRNVLLGRADRYFPSTVLLLSGDNSVITDESFVRRGNATQAGNCAGGSSNKKFGRGAIGMDGVGDYATFADSADFTFGADDFTVECWFAHNSTTAHHLISKWLTTGNQREFSLVINDSSVQFFWSTDGVGSGNLSTGAITITEGTTFYHTAFSRVGNTAYILFDGLVKATADMTGITLFNSTALLAIGANLGASVEFDGWADEVRITKGVGRYFGASGSAYTLPHAAFPRS